MTAPIEVEILIGPAWLPGAPKWRVDVQGTVGRERPELVDPLRDEDVCALPHVPEEVTTWRDLAASFSPGGGWRPPLPTMKAIGRLLRDRLFGHASFARHFAAAEARARDEGRPLRLLLETEPDDGETGDVLPALPLELAYNGERFVFKQPGYGALRCNPQAQARNLVLPRKGRALLATAHADGREPSAAKLEAHRTAITAAVEAMGWEAISLPDATEATLKRALLEGEGADLLYVACHGLGDPSYGGRLCLRGGQVTGETLGQWLEDAARRGRPVGAALLCACSSATPERGEDTSGMAQWLALEGRANTALGFRGPVEVGWALGFLERMFEQMRSGERLERAFVSTRADVKNEEPQWALPVLYVRRSDMATLALPEVPLERSFTATFEAMTDAPPAHVVERFGHLAGNGDVNGAERLRKLVERALAGLPGGDLRLFFALAGLPSAPRSGGEIARLVGEPAPRVAAKLWRLAQRGLLRLSDAGARGAYALDADVLAAARALAASDST